MFGRKGDPELESARPAGLAGTAAVPCTVTGLEPFDPALRQNPGGAGCVFISHAALQHAGKRRDAGMRMQSEAGKRRSFLGIEEVEEDEGFDNVAKVRRAHQAGDGSV